MAESTFERGAVVSFKNGQAGFEQPSPGHDDDIEPRRDLIMSENLSYQPFSSISLDGAAEFLRGGYPQAPRFLMVGQEENRAEAAVEADAILVDLLKIRPSPDPLIGTESSGSAHDRVLFAADSEAFTTLRPAAFEHQTPVLRAHANQKTVRPRTAPACSAEMFVFP